MQRRNFLKYTTLLGASAIYSASASRLDSLKSDLPQNAINETESKPTETKNVEITESKFVFPPLLKPGDKVAFASPSSVTNVWEINNAVRVFKAAGLEIEIGSLIKNQNNKYRYLASSDDSRAKEFMELVEREDIKAIISARGGYGAMRMVDLLDFEIIRKNPKIYIGFSDFTFLLNAISQAAKVVTYHGPVGVSSFTNFSSNYLLNLVLENRAREFKYEHPNSIVLVEGQAEGRIVGGNLTMLVASLGTKYEIDTKDAIIFFEDTNEQPYQIDRMLTQLKLAGKFESAKAILVGNLNGLRRRRPFYPSYSFTMMEVLEQILVPLKIPVLVNLPIGHIPDQITIPLNSIVQVDTKAKSINFTLKT